MSEKNIPKFFDRSFQDFFQKAIIGIGLLLSKFGENIVFKSFNLRKLHLYNLRFSVFVTNIKEYGVFFNKSLCDGHHLRPQGSPQGFITSPDI